MVTIKEITEKADELDKLIREKMLEPGAYASVRRSLTGARIHLQETISSLIEASTRDT